jgi:hypothetical protein
MFLVTRNIIMNKVISHIHHIYITSPLLKKKLGYKLKIIFLKRLTRWGLMLQEYNLIIKHITYKDNFIANVLSRVGQYCDELK